MKKLSIIVPHYNEPEHVVMPLLQSIYLQQSVNFEDIEVIVVNDGEQYALYGLSERFPQVRYLFMPHGGVSVARQYGLDNANGEYVMFCDCDDMFYSMMGLYVVLREMEIGQFDALMSAFIEETRDPQGNIAYITHQTDNTFVHGKVYRRQYLIDNNIKWNSNFEIHEDSFFNALALKLTPSVKYCQQPFYLWKWQDNSVCRRDPLYIQKTFTCMLESNTALVEEFIKRGRASDAQFYATSMIYDSYFNLNLKAWLDSANKEYRDKTEQAFAAYYNKFEYLYNAIDEKVKAQIIMNLKNRMF